jgi:predicted small secreted protein
VELSNVSLVEEMLACNCIFSKEKTVRKHLSITLSLLALLSSAVLVSACQTTAGVGQDLSNGGKALRNSAERNAPPGDR